MLYFLIPFILFLLFSTRKSLIIKNHKIYWHSLKEKSDRYLSSEQFHFDELVAVGTINYQIPNNFEDLLLYDEDHKEDVSRESRLMRTPKGRKLLKKEIKAKVCYLELQPNYLKKGELLAMLPLVKKQSMKDRIIALVLMRDNIWKKFLRSVY